jgi:hypothetical protein
MRRFKLILCFVAMLVPMASGQVIVRHREPAPNGFNAHGFTFNPFGSWTGCVVDLPDTVKLSICVWDSLGKTVFESESHEVPPGRYSVTWDGRNSEGEMASIGIYLLEVSAKAGNSAAANREIVFRAKGRVFLYRD